MDGTALRVREPATAAGRRRGPGRPSRHVGRERGGIWFAMPFLLAFTLVMIAPLGYAIYTSLYTTRDRKSVV